MIDPDVLRALNAILAVGVLFALVVALTAEWSTLSRAWRRVLLAFAAQQIVIAYGSIEARGEAIPGGLRVWLLFASLTALAVSLAALLIETYTRHGRPVR